MKMPGRKNPRASPERAAKKTAMARPKNPESACWSGSRRTSRSAMTSSPVATAAISAACSAWSRSFVIASTTAMTKTKTTAGRPLSTRPRLPPSASTSAVRSTRSAGTVTASSCWASGNGRTQLVRGVVDRRSTAELREPTARDQRAAGLDAPDAPAAEPDQRDAARPVVQLGLERRGAGARAQRDGAQRPGDADRLALAAGRHGGGAGLLGLLLELAAGELVVVQRQPGEGAPEASLLGVHGHRLSVRRGG